MHKGTLFFDYDGTLHNSLKIYYPAFIKAYEYLVSEGICELKEWLPSEVGQWLGYNKEEMWQSFMPDLDESRKKVAGGIIGDEMNRLTSLGKAELYPGTIDVLECLKSEGYTLVFISNCSKGYMNTHRDLFNLDKYFSYYYNAEQFDYISKKDILKSVLHKHDKPFVMIGDRSKDFEAGRASKLTTVGCRYGYGSAQEYETCDYLIENIEELLTIKHLF